MFHFSVDSLYSVVRQEVCVFYSEVPSLDSTIVEILNTVSSTDLICESADVYFDTMENYMPSAMTELQIIRPVITNLSLIETGENKVAYMNTVIGVVNNANVNDLTKAVLKTGITIARVAVSYGTSIV